MYSLPDFTILRIVTRLHIQFTVGQRAGNGRKGSVMPEKWKKVRDCVVNNPRVSVHKLSSQVNMSRTTIHRTLHALKLKPYCISAWHELKPTDSAKWIPYCIWFKTFTHDDASRLDNVYFSDKVWVHLDTQLSDMVRRQSSRVHWNRPTSEKEMGLVWNIT